MTSSRAQKFLENFSENKLEKFLKRFVRSQRENQLYDFYKELETKKA
jgi:hypothetical protein